MNPPELICKTVVRTWQTRIINCNYYKIIIEVLKFDPIYFHKNFKELFKVTKINLLSFTKAFEKLQNGQ